MFLVCNEYTGNHFDTLLDLFFTFCVLIIYFKLIGPGVVKYTYNLSPQEAKAGGSLFNQTELEFEIII